MVSFFRAGLRGLVLAGLLCGLGLFSTGCGDPNKARAKVTGKVTIGGKALTGGTVLFVAKDNRSGTGMITPNGTYECRDAPIGDCTVVVSVPTSGMSGKGMMGGMGGMPGPPGGMNPAMGGKGPEMKPKVPGGLAMKDPSGSGPSMSAPQDPGKMVTIPEKYGKTETSGLSYKVVAGDQTHDINLTP